MISATEFKAKCLSLLEQLDPEGIIVTKRGHAIARVLPINVSSNEKLIGSMKGKIRVKGELLSTGIHWNAESGYTYRRRSSRRRPEKA